MRQGKASTKWLLLTILSAALLPFACSKEEPAPETATSAEPATSVEPANVEPTSDPAGTEAPAASASVDPTAEAIAAASAAAAPTSGKAKEPTERGTTPSNPAVPNPPAPNPTPAPPAGYTGPDPCRATSFKFASVRNACNQGGVKQAKSLMKGMVKRAKDDGKEMKCSSCHDDTKTYTLKSNAVDDMRALQ